MINYDEKNKIFHLSNGSISYVLGVDEHGILEHLYFGAAIKDYHGLRTYPRVNRDFSPNLPDSQDRLFSLDTVLQEYPTAGNGDFRAPAQSVQFENGSTVTELRYDHYRIIAGKPGLSGLPATFSQENGDAQTLVVTLIDSLQKLAVDLNYTIFKDSAALVRSTKIRNQSGQLVKLKRALSMNLDLPTASYDLIHLRGAWARERNIERVALPLGTVRLGSNRGVSSHQENPFFALAEKKADERSGAVYAVNFVYSGDFEATIETDPYKQLRVQIGIDSEQFEWPLEPSASFQTPEVVMVYSATGLTTMSQTFHQFYHDHLIRSPYKDQERPILLNNWEATYFDFNEAKLLDLMDAAQKVGIELFVLDDGWFGQRDSDFTSLGDWFENRQKLSHGLSGLAAAAHQRGLKFGLWVEPEMISRQSRLFEQHPDWYFHIPGRGAALSRSQYVLDLTRPEVRANIYDQIEALLSQGFIDYLKWDMNRPLTDVFSSQLPADQQGTLKHRYVLGLYELMERLISQHPEILFEACASGGGRFDPGMLYYMPQVWTSDNTDPVARLAIQTGTSLAYPLNTMGAHVSASPNEQTGRRTSLNTRGNVAFFGDLGYELDLTELSTSELAEIKTQINFYKKYRALFQSGKFYRLDGLDPEDNYYAWQVVSANQESAAAQVTRVLGSASEPFAILRFRGLNPNWRYTLDSSETVYNGDELMNAGIYLNWVNNGDFASKLFMIQRFS
ncbi:alpha-galactosidase [Lapidilactobacillus luobeiensis]|uniref:alpha-galactosidase n=1 Tax=Lapidilactobacillus luobeiensis TaxID=2950371 RepID=UPI0021C3F7FE|nr:alpha-galactosidase [Lapidilactobacillus luobeiensis]